MKTLIFLKLKYAVPSLCAFIILLTSASVARAETLYFFKSLDTTISNSCDLYRTIRQKTLLKLGENDNILIQYHKATITIAYNTPSAHNKQSWQFDSRLGINPIKLGMFASLTF